MKHVENGRDVRAGKKGTSFLEYALLAALIGIVGAVGVMKYGDSLLEFFDKLAEKTSKVTPQ